jgi:cell division protein FtsX
MMACSTIAIGRSNEFDEGTDRYYEMTKSRGGAFEGVLRVRTQWRHAQHQGQEGLEDWSPLPDVEEDDDDIPNDDVADVEDSWITKLRTMLKAISDNTIFGVIVMCAIMISIIAMVRLSIPSRTCLSL